MVEIRWAHSVWEARSAGDLENRVWGTDAFQRYEELYSLGEEFKTKTLVVAGQDGELIGHVGLIPVRSADLKVGMPHWNFDPKIFFKRDSSGWYEVGNVWYITGHAVDTRRTKELGIKGLSAQIINYLLEEARKSPGIQKVAVICDLDHPTLGKHDRETKTGGAPDFWKRYGFRILEETYDPNWRRAPDKEPTGAVICAIDVK